ncbi:trimethyllysine dioxygenase [Calycina marina]|uniref:Trimethyllysine dioxygenase n=1 Tax=Calycina marina TaxID=1763456 RepID=A0A9P8CHX0_9HELO|nr:trimethyllysine dioxygenase [Calycina marina]
MLRWKLLIGKVVPSIMPQEVTTEVSGLNVTWPDGHMSVYPWKWLYRHRDSRKLKSTILSETADDTVYWSSEIENNAPSIHYDEVMASDKGVGKWTSMIKKYGFCYVDGCPVDPDKTQKLLERIAFIRQTHYGGFYDFTSDLMLKDTAYTTEALGPHTDNTYFTDPSGLQMFHLLSHEEGTGGESFFVDGFNAAHALEREDPLKYKQLCKTPVPWHASGNKGMTITPAQSYPVLNTLYEPYQDKIEARTLYQVRWNNADRGVIPIEKRTGTAVALWYEAARSFDTILKRKDMQYRVQLEPGRAIIFDNWRVLHAREAFTGKRRMCGGYINRDDWISRWRNTNWERQEVLNEIL